MSSASRHWQLQRLTAIALVPLGLWFLASLLGLPDATHATVLRYFSQPLAALLTALFAGAALWHSMQGLQVIVEDYVGGRWHRPTLTALRIVHAALALAAAWAIATLATGGGA